jgi:hypothetical protein
MPAPPQQPQQPEQNLQQLLQALSSSSQLNLQQLLLAVSSQAQPLYMLAEQVRGAAAPRSLPACSPPAPGLAQPQAPPSPPL